MANFCMLFGVQARCVLSSELAQQKQDEHYCLGRNCGEKRSWVEVKREGVEFQGGGSAGIREEYGWHCPVGGRDHRREI